MAELVLKRSKARKPELGPIYTAEEVAEMLSLTVPTVKRWMTDGLIEYIQFPKDRRIRARALDEFLERRTIEAD